MKYVVAENINWSDVKSVSCNRVNPLKINLKYFSRDSEEIVSLYKQNFGMLLSLKNENEIEISKAKHEILMKKPLKYIPPEKHSYYQTISYNESNIDHFL